MIWYFIISYGHLFASLYGNALITQFNWLLEGEGRECERARTNTDTSHACSYSKADKNDKNTGGRVENSDSRLSPVPELVIRSQQPDIADFEVSSDKIKK